MTSRRQRRTTGAALARSRRNSTAAWPPWRWFERLLALENEDQQDDEQDEAADTDIHDFSPVFGLRLNEVKRVSVANFVSQSACRHWSPALMLGPRNKEARMTSTS